MPREIPVGKGLSCGCCGDWFETWEGYVDQDQDNGYGICKDCQEYIDAKNEKQYDDMIKQILEAVKPETAEKMRAKIAEDPDMKYAYVNGALDQGFFTFSVSRAS